MYIKHKMLYGPNLKKGNVCISLMPPDIYWFILFNIFDDYLLDIDDVY